MNTFKFIGTIPKPKSKDIIIKKTTNNKKYLKLLIRQNENNSAYVQMYGDNLIKNGISVFFKNTNKREIVNYDDRFNENILKNVSNISKYTIYHNDNKKDFIWKDDFIECIYEFIMKMPENTIYEITGEYSLSYYNNKLYNNFNIKTIRVGSKARPELKMSLDLFYNYKSLDERDKRNKFLLNAYIQEYVYSSKRKEYFPLQVQFITNRFNFKNPTHVEIIKHRKSNLQPTEQEGYVKSTWEAQYVRGAQLILPPLETLPKDIQFEIKNAGRDIKEYMSNVIGVADEFICLTRPVNNLNKDGKVYLPINCTNNEFESKININFRPDLKQEDTIDFVAKNDAIKNPFN